MICNKCGKEFDIIYRGECNICGVKRRNKDRYEKVISDKFWTKEEIDTILEQLLYVKPKVINEIMKYLPNKKISDLVSFLRREFPIRGQTPQKVAMECSTCGNEFVKTLEFYEKKRKYCSFECRNIGKVRFGVHSGENNPKYNSEYIKCTNCGKEYLAPKYKQEQTNSYGENNHYCSQECYWGYRGKHYIKEKNGNYGKIFSEETRKEMSIRAVELLCSGKIPQTKTKPHIKINLLLDKIKIKYTNEYNCKYHALDIYLDNYNLGIEVMGDYWHGSPIKYKKEELTEMHKKDIKQDKSKHTYVKKYHGFEILYLWEYDIKNNIELCEKLIKLYIKNNGILQDYNSFNYYVNGSELLLKSEIVYPYFIKSNP